MYQNMRPKRGYQTFIQELKEGKLKNVILLTGKEEYLIQWAGDWICRSFIHPAAKAVDCTVLDGENTELSQVMEACETFPMLSDRRVIWVKSFSPLQKAKGLREADAELLLQYLKNPNDRAILMFSSSEIDGRSKVVKALKKEGSYYSFDELSENELMSFAHKRFQKAGMKISRPDMRFLIQSTGYFNKESGYHLYQFENDLQKIIAHAENGCVRREDIETMVSGDGDTFIFNLLDGISGNDKKTAFRILHNKLTENSNEAGSIVGAIVSQVELMLEIREFLEHRGGRVSASQISKYTGINEYRIKKAMNYARRYSLNKLQEMLMGIYEVNMNIVSGLLDARTALEMYIARI
jgi:DNA polymerase-3 subunit delta